MYILWNWNFDYQFGIAQYILTPIFGEAIPVFRKAAWVLPTVAMTEAQAKRIRKLDTVGLLITVVSVIFTLIWMFPLYWAMVTTLKPETEVI